jgi:hypothetical protein
MQNSYTTPGWKMNVTYTITVLFSAATPDFLVELIVLPPPNDVAAAGNVY